MRDGAIDRLAVKLARGPVRVKSYKRRTKGGKLVDVQAYVYNRNLIGRPGAKSLGRKGIKAADLLHAVSDHGEPGRPVLPPGYSFADEPAPPGWTFLRVKDRTGKAVGDLDFSIPPKGVIKVDSLGVDPEHQRKGLANALMDEAVRRHPGMKINHGEQSAEGAAWAKQYDARRAAATPKKSYPPLTREQFSDPNTERTRAVSTAEFNDLAAKGEARLAEFHQHASPPTGLDKNWKSIKDDAWAAVQDQWGGVTVDAHTGEPVTGNPNKYALTVRPAGVHSVTMPVGSDRATFDKAMDDARQRFDSVLGNEHYHLGVFRDDAIDRIDIDPVLVLDDHADVESIGAFAHSEGGAYNFSDGNGYWPPYVDEGLDNAGHKRSPVQGAGRVVRASQDSRGPPSIYWQPAAR